LAPRLLPELFSILSEKVDCTDLNVLNFVLTASNIFLAPGSFLTTSFVWAFTDSKQTNNETTQVKTFFI
jgi:hypothetical protein